MPDLNDADDLEAMIVSLGGVPVVYGDVTTSGLLDEPNDVVFVDGQVLTVDRAVRVPAGKVTGLRIDDPITVNGVAYTVRNRHQNLDRGLTVIALRDA